MGKRASLWDMLRERPEWEDQFSKAMTALDQLVRTFLIPSQASRVLNVRSFPQCSDWTPGFERHC